jgi:hypothetical protein
MHSCALHSEGPSRVPADDRHMRIALLPNSLSGIGRGFFALLLRWATGCLLIGGRGGPPQVSANLWRAASPRRCKQTAAILTTEANFVKVKPSLRICV